MIHSISDQLIRKGAKAGVEYPQEGAERGGLDAGRHIGGDGGRGALIDVRRPHVEGHGGRLEAETHDDQGHPDHEHGGQGEFPGHDKAGNVTDVEDAGRRINQRHAVKQKGRGKSAEKEVLEGGLGRPAVAAQEPAEDIDGDGHELQADEDGDEMVRRDHDHHPQDPEEQQGIVFPFDDPFALHVPKGKKGHQQGNDQRQPFEERAEIVDGIEVVENVGIDVP